MNIYEINIQCQDSLFFLKYLMKLFYCKITNWKMIKTGCLFTPQITFVDGKDAFHMVNCLFAAKRTAFHN